MLIFVTTSSGQIYLQRFLLQLCHSVILKIQKGRDSGRAWFLFFAVHQPLYEVTSPPCRSSGFPFMCRGVWDLPIPRSHMAASLSVNGFTIRVQLNHRPAIRGEKTSPFLCNAVCRDRQQMSTAKNIPFSCVWWGAETEELWEGGSHSHMLWIFLCSLLGIQEIRT